MREADPDRKVVTLVLAVLASLSVLSFTLAGVTIVEHSPASATSSSATPPSRLLGLVALVARVLAGSGIAGAGMRLMSVAVALAFAFRHDTRLSRTDLVRRNSLNWCVRLPRGHDLP